jgi:four helix bundle protein
MATKDFAELKVYRIAEDLADEVWRIVKNWDRLAQDTVGKQVVRCADSIGANLAEGTGRGTYQDNRPFRPDSARLPLRNPPLAPPRP